MANIKPKYSTCVACNREYAIDSFFEKNTKTFVDDFSNGYMCYCKKCCEEMLKYYIKKTGTLQSGFYYTCARLDIPFLKKPYDAMLKMKDTFQARSKTPKDDTEYNLFGWYYDFVWGKSTMMKPTDIWNGFVDSDMKAQDDESVKSKEAIQLEMDKYKLDWGNQETIEDYKYLTYVYNKYTQGIKIESSQQDDLLRDLCIARLDKRKVDDGRTNEDITKIQNRILTLLKTLKLDNFESSKPKSLSEQFLSNKIALIDENNVKDIYNKKCEYKDINKIQEYYRDMCLRPLGNMLLDNRQFDIDINDIEKYNMDNINEQ